jgi:uncharacterized membrane protein YraQ (UPF0718 family)
MRRPTALALVGAAAILAVSAVVPALEPLHHGFLRYLWLIVGPVALGLVIGGAIDYYVPREYVSRWLARPGPGSLLRAVGLGFLASACSHGILALTVELYRKGASVPSTVAFLLASPWANLPVTVLLFGFFGLPALWIIGAALVVALITGSLYQWLERRGWVEQNPHQVHGASDVAVWSDLRARWREHTRTPGWFWRADLPGIARGAWSLADMVLWWILVGAVLAAAIGAYVPASWMHRYMGPTLGGLLVTLAAATVIEVCSEGSAPLAFEVYRHGAIGNAYVFLMGGVVTDYTEIGLLWTNIGRRTALWLPALTVPQVLVIGWLLNRFVSH